MTLDEFFEKLPRDGWAITPIGTIRRGLECPIIAVADDDYTCDQWPSAADSIGLEFDDSHEIACASDGDECDPALRARLLAHCGLTEIE
jgi:hypothetical protein